MTNFFMVSSVVIFATIDFGRFYEIMDFKILELISISFLSFFHFEMIYKYLVGVIYGDMLDFSEFAN